MSIDVQELLEDLAPFADLGADLPEAALSDLGAATVRLIRGGQKLTLIFDQGSVLECRNGDERRHQSFRALLASQAFADLGRWADAQCMLIKNKVVHETLEMTGASRSFGDGGVDLADKILTEGVEGRTRNVVLLIDGPAGIGKTSFVRKLTYRRACEYRTKQKPLILHVESRGRVLQNITDLMAFSLQTLRVGVTYDQIPVLVRHGLITLAIDGFDELGDPNGYDLAWAQLNDLISSARGRGSFLLSGRETFISSARVGKALPSVDTTYDTLEAFTIRPIEPNVARSWLKVQGWSDASLQAEASAPIFVPGSYALRPFFLSQLASSDVASQVAAGQLNDVLSFLVNGMIDREERKFGHDVEAVTTKQQREQFISSLMMEVARDLADNQTNSIAGETLVWLSDAVSQEIPSEVRGILRNRVQVIAFLTDDDRRGYKKFIHDQVQNYFLSKVTVSAISSGEVPKFIRRNIIGLDFLESFIEVARVLNSEECEGFVESSLKFIDTMSDQDRSRRNLSSLILALCSVQSLKNKPTIKDVCIDEALLAETVCPVSLERVTIAQLDARGADLGEVEFTDCFISTLIGDSGTIPSRTIPKPAVLALRDDTLVTTGDVENWLGEQFFTANPSLFGDYSLKEALERYPLIKLLARYARYRPFWLKDTEEKPARKILDDVNWPVFRDILLEHDFLTERTDVPSSGPASPFYHLKNREALMDLDHPADSLFPLLRDLVKATPPKD